MTEETTQEMLRIAELDEKCKGLNDFAYKVIMLFGEFLNAYEGTTQEERDLIDRAGMILTEMLDRLDIPDDDPVWDTKPSPAE